MATDKLLYSSWNTLPIGKYLEIKDILEDKENEDRDISILSVLTGLDVDTIMDMSIFDVEYLSKQASFIYTPIPKRMAGIRHFVIDGEKYDVCYDFSRITTAQYIDFNSFISDTRKYYANILTTFIIPHGKKYCEGYEATELANMFLEKLDVQTAENAYFFFASCSLSSMKVIQTLFIHRLKRMMRKEKDREKVEKIESLIKSFQQQKRLLTGLRTLMQ